MIQPLETVSSLMLQSGCIIMRSHAEVLNFGIHLSDHVVSELLNIIILHVVRIFRHSGICNRITIYRCIHVILAISLVFSV